VKEEGAYNPHAVQLNKSERKKKLKQEGEKRGRF